jgi:hypothetical protein
MHVVVEAHSHDSSKVTIALFGYISSTLTGLLHVQFTHLCLQTEGMNRLHGMMQRAEPILMTLPLQYIQRTVGKQVCTERKILVTSKLHRSIVRPTTVET